MKRVSLKKARLIADMTEKEVCTALRIRKDRLEAWESGKIVPSEDYAFALADAYEIPIDFIDFSKEANSKDAIAPARKKAKNVTKEIKFNNKPLRERIINEYGSIAQFSAIIGIKDGTLRSRLNNRSYFTLEEIAKICESMNLNGREIDKLFFTTID